MRSLNVLGRAIFFVFDADVRLALARRFRARASVPQTFALKSSQISPVYTSNEAAVAPTFAEHKKAAGRIFFKSRENVAHSVVFVARVFLRACYAFKLAKISVPAAVLSLLIEILRIFFIK